MKLTRLGRRKSTGKVEILKSAPVMLVQFMIESRDSWLDSVMILSTTAVAGKVERHPSGDPEKVKPVVALF